MFDFSRIKAAGSAAGAVGGAGTVGGKGKAIKRHKDIKSRVAEATNSAKTYQKEPAPQKNSRDAAINVGPLAQKNSRDAAIPSAPATPLKSVAAKFKPAAQETVKKKVPQKHRGAFGNMGSSMKSSGGFTGSLGKVKPKALFGG